MLHESLEDELKLARQEYHLMLIEKHKDELKAKRESQDELRRELRKDLGRTIGFATQAIKANRGKQRVKRETERHINEQLYLFTQRQIELAEKILKELDK